MLGPLIARAGSGVFIAARVLQGVVEGPFYPALYVMSSKWLPREEKGNLFNLILLGNMKLNPFLLSELNPVRDH